MKRIKFWENLSISVIVAICIAGLNWLVVGQPMGNMRFTATWIVIFAFWCVVDLFSRRAH